MSERSRQFIEQLFSESIVPTLCDYIRIPNKSPHFDPDWAEHGHMDRATDLLAAWAREHAVEGMQLEVIRLPGRTPLIFAEIPGASDRTVLLYGHLDKQPEMTGWDEDKGPWKPVLEGDRLYGRGGADDGYALFSSLTAVAALHAEGREHSRCVLLIEACEESGSFDLPAYLEHLQTRIGTPDLVVCLDSECGDYDRLWLTTSLRGNVTGTLEVEVLTEGIHSGNGGGIVPESFRVARQLLERIEDSSDGRIRLRDLHCEIPDASREHARRAADILGEGLFSHYPFAEGVRPEREDPFQAILHQTWEPVLAVTGADGLPAVADAGNVLRPLTRLKLSLRIPPMVDGETAAAALKHTLEKDPPHGARVRFDFDPPARGWAAPPLAEWLCEALEIGSQEWFGEPWAALGVGATIPFMAMLGERFPQAQFLITGVLGPGANAHGPNEFLDLPTAQRVTGCVAEVLAAHYEATRV